MTIQIIRTLVLLCFFPSLLLAEVSADKVNKKIDSETLPVKTASVEEKKSSDKTTSYQGNKSRKASRFKFRPGR